MPKVRKVRIPMYLRNVGRSLHYAVTDVVSSYAPTLADIRKESKETYNDVRESMKKLSYNNISSVTKEFMSSPNIISNTLDDLKSGNWYNKEREENASFGGFDFDFEDNDDDWGDDWDSDDEDFDDGDESVDTDALLDQGDKNTSKVIGSMEQLGNDLSKSVAYSNARSAEYIVNNQNLASKALLDLNKQGFNQISAILLNMDNTLTGVAELGEPFSMHLNNSAVFFTTTTETLNKISENIQKLVDRTAYLDKKKEDTSSKASGVENIMSGGQFSLGSYKDFVKGNVNSAIDIVKSFGQMGSMMFGKKGENISLAGMLTKGIIESLIPEFTKDAIKDLNDAVSNAFTNGLMRAGNKAANSSNLLFNLLGGMFLPKSELKTNINPSKYEKGPIQWDGIAKKALVDVIPTYLSKITAALTGEEHYFDYGSGKFVNKKQIKEQQEKRIRSKANYAGADLMDAVRGKGDNIENEVKEFIYRSVTNPDLDFYEITKRKNDTEFLKKYGLTKESAQAIIDVMGLSNRKGYRSNKQRNLLGNFEREVYSARADITNETRKLEASGNSIEAKMGNDWFNDVTSALTTKMSEYNQYIYSLTANIYNLLLRGIRVKVVNLSGNGPFQYYNLSQNGFGTIVTDEASTEQENTNNENNTSSSSNRPNEYNKFSAKEKAKYDELETDEERKEFLRRWRIDHAGDIVSDQISSLLHRNDNNDENSEEEIEEVGQSVPRRIINKFKKLKAKVIGAPAAAVSYALNSLTIGINKLFWGEEGEGGLFDKIKGLFDRIKEKIVGKSTIPKGTVDIIPVQIEWQGDVRTQFNAVNSEGLVLGTVPKDAAMKWLERKNNSFFDRAKKKVKDFATEKWNNFKNSYTNARNTLRSARDQYVQDELNGTSNNDMSEGSGWLSGGASETTEESKKSVKDVAKEKLDEIGNSTAIQNAKERLDEIRNSTATQNAAGFIASGVDTLSEGLKEAFNAIIGDPNEDKKQLMDKVKLSISDFTDNKDAIGMGAIAGLGVSALSGVLLGPIAGAAIGAGAALVSKSTTLQNALFGEGDPESPEYKKGILGELGRVLRANKDTAKNTGIGTIAGLVGGSLLGSPLLGAMVGAGIGFVTKSSKAQEYLFGKEGQDDGLIKKELQNKIKSAAPNIAAGILATAVAGPFGIVGNVMLGAGLGYMSTTEKFKEFMFGSKDEETSKRKGGLLGKIHDTIMNPLNEIMHNLANAVAGFLRRTGVRVKGLLTKFGGFLKDSKEKLKNSNSPLGKIAGGLMSAGEAIIKAPVNIVGGTLDKIDTGLKKRALRKGDAVYDNRLGRNLTAEERLQLRTVIANGGVIEENGRYYKVNANGKRTELLDDEKSTAKEKYDRIVQKTASSNKKYKRNSIYTKFDEDFSKLSDEEKVDFLKNNSDETLKEKYGLNNIQLAQIKANVKSEQDLVSKKLKDEQARRDADPTYEPASRAAAALENISTAVNGILAAVRGENVPANGNENEENNNTDNPKEADKNGESNNTNNPVEQVRGENSVNNSEQSDKNDEREDNGGTHRVTETDIFGNPHVYTVDNDTGAKQEVTDDGPTKKSREMITKFTGAIEQIPVIGTLVKGFKSVFGSLKDALIGDEEKPGLLSKLFKGLFDKENGVLSGLFNFLTGSKLGTAVKTVLSNATLGTVIGGIALPALTAWAFTDDGGKFISNFASKFSFLKGNDTSNILDKTDTVVEDVPINGSNANNANATGSMRNDPRYQVQGATIKKVGVKDENGAIHEDVYVDNTFKRQAAVNFASGIIMRGGVNSTAIGKVAKGAKKSWKTMLGKGAREGAEAAAEAAFKPSILLALSSKIDNLFVNTIPKIVKNSKLLKAVAPSFVDKIDDIAANISTNILKFISKGSTKITKGLEKLLTVVDDLIPYAKIVWVAGRAINNWGNAESILGITEKATFGQRCIAVLIGIINSLIPGIGDLIPDKILVNIVTKALEIVGIDIGDLKEQRERAQQEVDEYNKKNNTNLSIEEYNQMNGKMGIITKGRNLIVNKAKAFAATAKEKGVKGAAEYVGQQVLGAAKIVGDYTGLTEHITAMKNGDLSGFLKAGLPANLDEFKEGGIKGITTMIPKLVTKMSLLPVAIPVIAVSKGLKFIKNVVNKGLASMAQLQIETEKGIELAKDPNVPFTELFNVSGIDNEDPENPLGKMASTGALVGRVFAIPIVIFQRLGKSISGAFSKIVNAVKGSYQTFNETSDIITEKMLEGDAKGIWELDFTDADGDGETNNVMGPIEYGILGIRKLFCAPVALLVSGIKSIKEKMTPFFTFMKDGNAEDAEKYHSYIDGLKSSSGMDLAYDAMVTQPEYGGPFGVLYGLATKTVGLGYGIKGLFQGLIDAIQKPLEWLEDKAEWVRSRIKTNGEKLNEERDQKAQERAEKKAEKLKERQDVANLIWSDVQQWINSGSGSGFVSQYDPKYQQYNVSNAPFASKGCGPAVASMAASAMGKNLSVGDAVSASKNYQNSGGVTLDYFQNALGSRGINTEIISGGSSSDLYGRIASGQKTILLGRDSMNTSKANSPFGPHNHYVLATGVDRSGNVIVNDPEARGPRSYSPSILNSVSYGIAGSNSGLKNRNNRIYRMISGGGGPARNDTTTQQIWAYLTTKLGMSEAAAAGVMGNMEQESSCRPDINQSGGGAYGLCQWDGGRRDKLKTLPNYQNLSVQLDYLASELTDPSVTFWNKSGTINDKDGKNYPYSAISYEDFKKLTDVATACIQFEAAFERAGKPMMATRIQFAADYYQMFTGKTYEYDPSLVTSAAPTSSGSTSSASSSDSSSSSSSSSNNGEKPKTIFSALGQIGTIFANAFNGVFNKSSSSSSNNNASSSSSSSSGGVTPGGALGESDSINGDMAHNFPYYNQGDPQWAGVQYGTGTIKSSGCGPSSMAMVLKSYGKNVTPVETAKWSVEHGYRVPNVGTSHGFFKAIGDEAGLTTEEFTDIATVKDNIAKGIPVIASMGPGDFTKVGHFLVVTGIDSNGLVVNDPGSKDRTQKYWDPDNALGQAKKFWAISKNGKGSLGGQNSNNGMYNDPRYAATSAMHGDSRYATVNTNGMYNDSRYAAAGSGLLDYNELAMMTGGSSGLLMKARPGSRLWGRISPSGGESTLVGDTASMLTSLSNKVKASGEQGTISQETVTKLLEAITDVLNTIANNTEPVTRIYNVLSGYLQAGGASGVKDEKKTSKPAHKSKTTNTAKTGFPSGGGVDSSITALVGVLADLAKG